MKTSLTNLRLNQIAQIESINQNELAAEYILELIDYGFLPGTKIAVSEKYASQNKIIVKIGRVYLSLRLSDAKNILVESFDA